MYISNTLQKSSESEPCNTTSQEKNESAKIDSEKIESEKPKRSDVNHSGELNQTYSYIARVQFNRLLLKPSYSDRSQ